MALSNGFKLRPSLPDKDGHDLPLVAGDGGAGNSGAGGAGGGAYCRGGTGGNAGTAGNAGNGGKCSYSGGKGGDGSATHNPGNGGDFSISGGDSGNEAGTGVYADGGDLRLTGGTGQGNGGDVIIQGGPGTNGFGGSVYIDGYDDSGSGTGNVEIGTKPETVVMNLGAVSKDTQFLKGAWRSEGRVHNVYNFVPSADNEVYEMTNEDEYVAVDTVAHPCTVKLLPNIGGRIACVVDMRGNAASKPITVVSASGEPVQGLPSFTMNVDRMSLSFLLTNLGWIIV